MCPDPSASISVKRLLTSRSHTPRAERIKQLNSSCVIQLSSSMSNSCKKSSQTQLHSLPHFKHIHKPILTTEHTRVIHPYALTNYMAKYYSTVVIFESHLKVLTTTGTSVLVWFTFITTSQHLL